jgi:hypothetical protein
VGQIELNREQAEALVARLAASLDAHCENPAEVQGEREPPPNTPQDLGESSQNLLHKESKFWTYLLEDVKTKDVGDPSQYITLDQVLTHAQFRQMRERGEIPSLHHLRDTS